MAGMLPNQCVFQYIFVIYVYEKTDDSRRWMLIRTYAHTACFLECVLRVKNYGNRLETAGTKAALTNENQNRLE